MPSLGWNTAGTCFSNMSEALPLLEIGLYLLITVRWNPDPGADCSILRQAILLAGLSQGGRAAAAPSMDCRRMQPGGMCKDAPAGLAGTAAEGQSSVRGADLASTALPLPGPHPSAAQGGPAEVAGAGLASVQEGSSSAGCKQQGAGREMLSEQLFACRTQGASAALREEQVSPHANCLRLHQRYEPQLDVQFRSCEG